MPMIISQHSEAVAGGHGLREVKIMVLIMRDHYRIVAPADRGEA